VALRAVYDANVLISGLVFEGPPGRCLDAVEAGSVRCIMSWGILRDVIEKLATKFRHPDGLLLDELGWLVHHTEIVQPPRRLIGICRDPDDDAVIESAVISGAEYIVTGDNDLLALRGYQGIRIVTPREFATHLR
jgi:putative PIN family toxin of toxin-antitoxin system